MAITYKWEIMHFNVVDFDDKPNAIVEIFWKKTGTDEDGNFGTYNGETRFNPEIIKEANIAFSDFKKLKEKTVLKWVEDSINVNLMMLIDETIQNNLNKNKYNIRITEVPWKKD